MLATITVVLIGAYVAAPDGRVGELTYLAAITSAAALAGVGWYRTRTRVSALLAAGVAFTATGDLAWQVLTWIRPASPDVSVADVFWIGAYLAIAAAVLTVLQGATATRLDVDVWVDIGVITIAALVLEWQFSIADIVSDSSTPWAVRMVWAVYPALDAALIALVVRAAVARRLDARATALLLTGVACWLVADVSYTLIDGAANVALDVGWLVAALLLAGATWQPLPTREGETDWVGFRVSNIRLAFSLAPLLLPPAVEVASWARGDDPNPVPLLVASTGLVVLAYVRASRLNAAHADARGRLASRERRAQAIAANGSDASVIVRPDGTVVEHAPQLAALIGYDDLRTEGTNIYTAVHPADLTAVRRSLGRAVRRPGESAEIELRTRHRDGHVMWIAARFVSAVDDPDIGGVIVNVRDISDRKAMEEQLSHQAFHDGLTGLSNRALFTDRVDHALQRAARTGLQPAVIFLDLDGFKTVNDSLGHGAGDELLVEVARRLSASVRPSDTAARLGGDEFAVLVEESLDSADEAVLVADRILLALSTPFDVAGQRVRISASLGIAVAGTDATATSLLRDADVAMYRAKADGKAQWVVHDGEMRAAAMERLQLESDLLHALESGQFRLVYQPVVELDTRAVVGFEALLRWHHPSLGVILPDRFVPIAEENGLIVPIGADVLRDACRAAVAWSEGRPDLAALTISVNVSARQIASPDLVVHVAEALAHSGLEAGRLVIEMTETALIQDADLAAHRLQDLRDLGVRLAVDDFGTGYSSLSYLRQFPVDILKIDRSFIAGISDEEQVPALVRGLLDLGRTLELETIAEGVELPVQLDWLRNERCQYGQGFLFARPLPADEVVAALDAQRIDDRG